MMHIEVKDDQISIGAEFVPRFLDLPRVLQVKVGDAFMLSADSTWDYIEVAGTLSVSREHDTVLRFTHLFILPGGHLDCGSDDDPMPRRVEFVFRDVAIDKTRDPFQWGNGFLNFGQLDRCGLPKTAFVHASGSIAAGATSIALADDVQRWEVGDELLIPDMETPPFAVTEIQPRRETKVTIASITGRSVGLLKPLDFAHPTIFDTKSREIVRPYVSNLTRNIVLRNENDANPGHTADIGMMAMWCQCYNEIRGLGRTTIDPLADQANGVAGKNQRGRYAAHHHHVGSSPKSMDVGNVYRGRGFNASSTKWGLSHHNTSDTEVLDNIVVDFPGGGFVTEDGYEVRNRYMGNFAAYNLGHALDSQGNVFDAPNNVARGAPGAEGTGFWLHGIMNYFEWNVSINNFTSGMNLFNQSQPDGLYPSVPGGEPDTPLKHFLDRPLSFNNNVMIANAVNGFEIWGTGRFPYENVIAAHNLARNVAAFNSDGIDLYLVNAQIIGEVGKAGDREGVHASKGYVGHFEMDGGQISGCAIAVQGGGGSSLLRLTNVELDNDLEFDMLTSVTELINVTKVKRRGQPFRYIRLGDGSIWEGGDAPLPKAGVSTWIPARGSRLKVVNYLGTGKDYLLFEPQSLADNPAMYASSAEGVHVWNCPIKGLTNQQSWDQFGLAPGGGPLKNSDAVILEGLENGYGREGLDPGIAGRQPRFIVTFPTLREPAHTEGEPNDQVIRFAGLLTGDPDMASSVGMVQIDDGVPIAIDRENTDERGFTAGGNAADPKSPTSKGVHTIKAWRTKKDAPTELLHGSEYFSSYRVGEAEGTLAVPDVVGQVEKSAIAAMLAAGFTIGAVLDVPSEEALIGIVVRQDPIAGTQKPPQSQMVLFIGAKQGIPPVLVTVPNVVGMTHANAVSTISALGLMPTVTMQNSSTVPSGHIMSQAPAAGTAVAPGSSVNLIESNGPTPPSEETWTSAAMTVEKSSKGRVRIIIGLTSGPPDG